MDAIIIISWIFSFIFILLMLYGWTITYKEIRDVTGYKDKIITNTLTFLWFCAISSFFFPLNVIYAETNGGYAKLVVSIMSVIMSLFSFLIWTSYNRCDKEKYIRRAILRVSSISDEELLTLDYEEIVAIGRRSKLATMFNDFKKIQKEKNVRQTANDSINPEC